MEEFPEDNRVEYGEKTATMEEGCRDENRAGHQFLPIPHHSQVCTQGTGINAGNRAGHQFLPFPYHSQVCRQRTGINTGNRAGHQFLPIPHHSQVCRQGTGINAGNRGGHQFLPVRSVQYTVHREWWLVHLEQDWVRLDPRQRANSIFDKNASFSIWPLFKANFFLRKGKEDES
jgi:hypothetical protein